MTAASINGLWLADFIGPSQSSGSGLLVFQDGVLRGGDIGYFYLGTYSITANFLKANLVSRHYRGPFNNIFGPFSESNLIVEGAISDPFIMGQGYDTRFPANKMSFKLQRLSN